MILRMRYGLVLKMHRFPGMAPTMLLQINIIQGNAIVNNVQGSVYLDSDFNGTSDECNCMFRDELFECNKEGTL